MGWRSLGLLGSRNNWHERRVEIADYLTKFRDSTRGYHNHKETLGWAGVAVYLAGILQLNADIKTSIDPKTKPLIMAGVVAITVVFFAYSRRQFNFRYFAARIYWATERLLAEALTGKWDNPTAKDLWLAEVIQPSKRGLVEWILIINPWNVLNVPGAVFPRRLASEMNATICPAFVVEMIQQAPKDRGAAQLEYATYALMALACAATLVRIWQG
jgi:hypothetical protein